jgi:hypothetical protein
VYYGELKRVLVDKCKQYDPPVDVEEKTMEMLENIVQETTKAIIEEDHQVNMLFRRIQKAR